MSNEYKQLKKILKLFWALYDQKKSSLLWLRILIDKCIELELNSIFDEFCLFSNDNEILMFFYVDDIVFAFIVFWEKDAKNLIRRLKNIFDMRDLDSLNFFLDVRILQKSDTIWLIQNFYMNKLIKNSVTRSLISDLVRTEKDWGDLSFSRDLEGLEYIDESSAS
jgi:hypothetical protein